MVFFDKTKEKAEKARTFLESGKYKEAAEAFVSLGDYASAARAMVCAKAYKEAAKLYEKANKPLDAAKLYLLVKEWEKAEELFIKAGDHLRAEIAREQIRKEKGEKFEPKTIMQETKEKTKDTLKQEEKEEEVWPQGDIFRALKAGEINIAVNLYLKAGTSSGWSLLQEPMSKKALQALAEMFLLARDYVVAGEAFRKLENFKKAADCLSMAGIYEDAADLYARCGEKVLAAQNLEKAHQWQRAADLYAETGNYIEAARCFEKMDEPVKAAGMYLKAQKPDIALPLLQSVPPTNKHFGQSRLLAGKILFQKGQKELAFSILEPLFKFDTSNEASIEILYQLGGLMETYNEIEKATEIYLRIQKTRFGYKDVEQRLENLKNRKVLPPKPTIFHRPSFATQKSEENSSFELNTSPLRDCSLLDRFTLDELRKLFISGNVIEPKEGEIIIKKGEYSKGLYFVLNGQLSFTQSSQSSKEASGFLKVGDYFGLGSLIQGPPQFQNIVAQKDTRLLFIPKENLESLFSSEPELGLKLFRSIAEILTQQLFRLSQKLNQKGE